MWEPNREGPETKTKGHLLYLKGSDELAKILKQTGKFIKIKINFLKKHFKKTSLGAPGWLSR